MPAEAKALNGISQTIYLIRKQESILKTLRAKHHGHGPRTITRLLLDTNIAYVCKKSSVQKERTPHDDPSPMMCGRFKLFYCSVLFYSYLMKCPCMQWGNCEGTSKFGVFLPKKSGILYYGIPYEDFSSCVRVCAYEGLIPMRKHYFIC